jgi:hypothetical protein
MCAEEGHQRRPPGQAEVCAAHVSRRYPEAIGFVVALSRRESYIAALKSACGLRNRA